MSEALAGLEDIDGLLLVEQLDGTACDHVEVGRRRPVLDQDVLAGSVGRLPDARGDALELGGLEAVEGRVARQETGGVVHDAAKTTRPFRPPGRGRRGASRGAARAGAPATT